MTLPGDIQVVHKEKDRKGGERLEEGTGKTVKCLSGYQPTGDSVIGTLVIRGGSKGRVQGVRTPPPPEMTCGWYSAKKNYVVYWC